MKKLAVGILAHVDAGKTTLTEGLLYRGGQLKKLGRVDHRDAFLDTGALERERGITIFSKQALLHLDGAEITLLDTPGHVDFSTEMERTLQVLDYAVLVVSGTDGVQGHTRTLWRLLEQYRIPAFLFINKMDLPGADRGAVLEQLRTQLGEGCVDFGQPEAALWEQVALCGEEALERYLEQGKLSHRDAAELIRRRRLFPCLFGSALRLEGVDALLEVLDGEQNTSFRDHFLEVPVDLSRVMFITTANTTSTIPRPLLDRMEVIELTSYTDEEKLQIARTHLLPKQMKEHGLKKSQLRISDDAIRAVITDYTRESGVRTLERLLGKLCRKAAMRLVETDVKRVDITPRDLQELLGVPHYQDNARSRQDQIGVVNGLAWTEVGGELLEVEAGVMEGSGKLELTGNLGKVMQESVQAAYTCLRSRAAELGIPRDFYKTKDIHVHFPEGAVPKDGPSAGIAIATAMLSALTGRPVRHDVAMTGEVTLRGRVLPIGGLKDKTMAAKRSGIRTVIIPKENEKDLEEIDQTVRAALRFVTAETVDAVFAHALALPKKEAAVEHLTAMAGLERQEVRCGDQL